MCIMQLVCSTFIHHLCLLIQLFDIVFCIVFCMFLFGFWKPRQFTKLSSDCSSNRAKLGQIAPFHVPQPDFSSPSCGAKHQSSHPFRTPGWHRTGRGFGGVLSLIWIHKLVRKVCVSLPNTLTLG
ncbi:unnamed protein product [Musa textilis]